MKTKSYSSLLIALLIGVTTTHAANRAIIRNTSEMTHAGGRLGNYYALIIGINNYQDPAIPDLKTAVNDATVLASILRERYHFTVRRLLDRDATWNGIDNALRQMKRQASENDSVLIYYAGHGELDRDYQDGWWIPADAKAGRRKTFYDNSLVQKALRGMTARHVLLIADSCYAGALFGKEVRSLPPMITDQYYLDMYNSQSRWGLTSGGKEPVTDNGDRGHSVFALQLLKTLQLNSRPYVSTRELFQKIEPVMANYGGQTPLCRPFKNAGDRGGEFVFVLAPAMVTPPPAPTADPFEDLEKKARIRKKWKQWQSRMETDYAKAQALAQSSALTAAEKKELWKRFLAVYNQENPFSDQDNRMRADAARRQKRTHQVASPSARQTIENSLGMRFVLIPSGTFTMGSPSNEPFRDKDEKQHPVTISKPFYMQTTEVTQGQWQKVMGNNPSNFQDCGSDCPVEQVSWDEVQDFIKKLNWLEDTDVYRLPTEAEWEYACRAGTQTPFAFGKCLSSDQANFDADDTPYTGCKLTESRGKTIPVGSLAANAWGLYDMHGNVGEWCQDWHRDYPSGTVTDPQGAESGSARVFRGGGWVDYARYCRSAIRSRNDPGYRGSYLGFRLLRTP